MATDQLEFTSAGKPLIEAPEPRELTPMGLLELALSNGAAIDVIERIAALQESARAREAKRQFDEAMDRAQNEISEVVPDLTNETTSTKYASFKALNRALRPVYLRNGFTLSFNGGESSKQDEILVLCDCSHRGGHTKQYMIPMDASGKGAKGGGVMSKVHAILAATSSGRSCLLRMIFNIALAADTQPQIERLENISERLEWMRNARHGEELDRIFSQGWDAADQIKDWRSQTDLLLARFKRCESQGELAEVFGKHKPFIGKLQRDAQGGVIIAKDNRKKELASR